MAAECKNVGRRGCRSSSRMGGGIQFTSLVADYHLNRLPMHQPLKQIVSCLLLLSTSSALRGFHTGTEVDSGPGFKGDNMAARGLDWSGNCNRSMVKLWMGKKRLFSTFLYDSKETRFNYYLQKSLWSFPVCDLILGCSLQSTIQICKDVTVEKGGPIQEKHGLRRADCNGTPHFSDLYLSEGFLNYLYPMSST